MMFLKMKINQSTK